MLRRQAHGSLDAQVLALGTLDQLGADLLERLHLARRERDTDLVDFRAVAQVALRVFGGVGHGDAARWVGVRRS